MFEMRTTAGPSRHVQWVLSGGPYTVWSHVRHVQVVCPPPWPRQASRWPTSTSPGPSWCPLGHRVGGWVIHFPAVVCTKLAQHAYKRRSARHQWSGWAGGERSVCAGKL